MSNNTLFFFKPWSFWTVLLTTNKFGSLVGTIIICIILATLYIFLPKSYTWWGIGLFLVSIGPILFLLPFIFVLLVLPNIFSGDWDIPMGCGRNKETGKITCI